MKVNLPVLSSKPKKPTFAAEPVWYLNSIPLSLLSSELGAESPPIVKIGSSTVTVVLFTVVVVPFTVKFPVIAVLPLTVKSLVTVKSLPMVVSLGNPTVIVPELSATSTSLEVPENVIVPPNAVAVELDPSVTVIELLAKFVFGIELKSKTPVEELYANPDPPVIDIAPLALASV